MEEKNIKLEGTVESVIYRNDDNGYTIIDIVCNDELITVVGELGNVEAGESLVLKGAYKNHYKFGLQFNAEYCERKLPSDAINIEKYLASGIIKGIGPALAKRIVSVFGDKTFEVIEKNPEYLKDVKGISGKKYKELCNEFKNLLGLRKITNYLEQYNIIPQIAMKTYQKFGSDAVDIVKSNPYILCSDGIDMNFRKADNIALQEKISKNSSERIIAGIKYILTVNAQSGHSCVPLEKLSDKAIEFLEISENNFYDAYGKAIEENDIVEYIKNTTEYVYLSDYYNAEMNIANHLVIKKDNINDNLDIQEINILMDIEEQENNIKYEHFQRQAISEALLKGIIVITGGPGTGKTTSINAIISIFEKMEYNVALTAPTGRASKRLSEITGHQAKTIHRLLEVEFDSNGKHKFVHNKSNPLFFDAVIVDEMSMVDVLLFSSLLDALTPECKIIMVGDSDQLPSVSAGNLLYDIIKSKAVPVIQLNEIFRQAKSSCIITNSHKIINGEYPDLTQKKNDFFFFRRYKNDDVLNLVSELVKTRLPKAFNYSYMDNIQVLTPSKKGTVGVIEINKRLQEELNPASVNKSEVKSLIYTFRTGDKVMQIKNNYNIVWYTDYGTKNQEIGEGIYNGDIGKIIKINRGNMEVTIDFEDKTAIYTFDMLSQLELAYAITVHKSQGCEFDAVIIPITGGYEKLYYRNLLYTAVTRAKKLLILIGSEEVIYQMVNNNRRTSRFTCLSDMMVKEKLKNK